MSGQGGAGERHGPPASAAGNRLAVTEPLGRSGAGDEEEATRKMGAGDKAHGAHLFVFTNEKAGCVAGCPDFCVLSLQRVGVLTCVWVSG